MVGPPLSWAVYLSYVSPCKRAICFSSYLVMLLPLSNLILIRVAQETFAKPVRAYEYCCMFFMLLLVCGGGGVWEFTATPCCAAVCMPGRHSQGYVAQYGLMYWCYFGVLSPKQAGGYTPQLVRQKESNLLSRYDMQTLPCVTVANCVFYDRVRSVELCT